MYIETEAEVENVGNDDVRNNREDRAVDRPFVVMLGIKSDSEAVEVSLVAAVLVCSVASKDAVVVGIVLAVDNLDVGSSTFVLISPEEAGRSVV